MICTVLRSYALLIIFINHVVNYMLNLMTGPMHFGVKFKDIPNSLDFYHVVSIVGSTPCTYRKHVGDPVFSMIIILDFFLKLKEILIPPTSSNVLGKKFKAPGTHQWNKSPNI